MEAIQPRPFYKKPVFILSLIIAAFFLRGVFLAVLFPIFQGPDEQTHYATVQYFAESKNKNWPIKKTTNNPPDGDNIFTYNYSEEIKKTAAATNFDNIKFQKNNTPFFSNNFDGPEENEIKNNQWKRYIDVYPPNTSGGSPSYYSLASVIEKIFSGQSVLFRFFSVRIFSVFLGSFVIFLLYLISKKIGFSEKNSLLITSIVAFQPMFSFMSSIVNPDILLFFCFTLFIFGAVSLLKDGITWKNTAILLFSIILGMLTKGPAIVLAVVAFFLFAYAIYRRLKISISLFFLYFLIFSLIALILVFNLAPTQYLSGITRSDSPSKFSSIAVSLGHYFNKTIGISPFSRTAGSYWGNFGWLDTKISGQIIDLIFIIEIVAVIGLLFYLFKKRKEADFLPEKKYLFLFIGLIIALQLAIRFYDWRVFDSSAKILIGTPGRYFMPNIAAHFILLAVGFGAILRKKEYFEMFLRLTLILMVVLQFYSIFSLIIPRYYL